MVEEVFLCGKRYFSGNNLPLDGLNIYTKIYHLIPLSEMKELLKPWEYKKISKLTNLDEVVLLHEIEREDLSNKLYKEIHCEAPIVETNKKLGDTLFYKKTSLEKKGIDTPNKSKEYKIEPNKKEVKVEEAPIFEIKNQILVKYNGDCETVTIPLDVKEVLVNAFNGKNVKTIIYNGNGVNLGWFSEINSLEELILGDNITEVSNNRSGYKKLKYIKFGKKINYIPLSSLSSVKQLEKVEFEAKDIRICDRAFSNCKNLKEVIGDGISYIDDYTFMGCESLVKIDLSNLIRIGRESFKDCSSLKEFTFGSKLNLIDKDILVNCKSLEVVNFYTEPSNISKLYLPLSFKSILSGCDNIKEFNHTASRADLLPYFNDEKGRLWKVPFKMVRVKK